MDRRADQTMSAPGCSTEQDQLCATSPGQKGWNCSPVGGFVIDRAPPDWASAECRRDQGEQDRDPPPDAATLNRCLGRGGSS
jgi:hypothetical protein